MENKCGDNMLDKKLLAEQLKLYEQEKCKQFRKVCFRNNDDNTTSYCPAFTADYDDDGYIVGGTCVISWLLEDLRCDNG